jgi:uncharacterized protein YlxW (UPF0749 family)
MTAPKFNAPVKEHVQHLAKSNSQLREDLDNKCKEVIALEKKLADVVGLFNEQETKAIELEATLKHLDSITFTDADLDTAVEAAWWRHGAEE